MQNKKLLIIDGLNIFRRVYEANPAPDSVGKAEGAIRASHNSMFRALREHNPSHVMLTFDAGGPTWRHARYPAYKQNRKPMPTPLYDELSKFKPVLVSEGWGLIEHPGFEADDTIASGAFEADAIHAEVVILSTDKDLASLASERVRIYDHFSAVWRDEAWCLAKFGVGPALLLDWLALTGDPVDGIPGVEGIGAKTATKFLQEHGNLKALLAAAGSIPGKMGARLQAQPDQARLSRELTELRKDLFPLGLDWGQLRTPAY